MVVRWLYSDCTMTDCPVTARMSVCMSAHIPAHTSTHWISGSQSPCLVDRTAMRVSESHNRLDETPPRSTDLYISVSGMNECNVRLITKLS